MKVQAFCEENGLGVFGYVESKNHCWQAKNGVFAVLFAYFQDGSQSEQMAIYVKELIFRMPNWYKSW